MPPKSETKVTIIMPINPATISEFTFTDGWWRIQFRDGTELKWRNTGTIAVIDGEAVPAPKSLPAGIQLGGVPCADGRPRCRGCDIVLSEDTTENIGGFCWTCCQQLDPIDTAIATLRYLKARDPLVLVRRALLKLKPTDAKQVDSQELTKLALKGS